ncbi:MAG TPA: MFS transporter [Solirubrobacteraceae bacterium]|nr:MFS transporter [Solirubrobacteraceae bacterium]
MNPPHPRRWLILAVVLMAECMDLLDGTVVNVAAPVIHRDLGTSSTGLEWIVGGYALAVAVGLVTGGRLGDIAGRRRTFLAGVAGFTLASLLCGLAPSTGTLIAARLLQGAAGALMLPQGLGLLRESFAPGEMAKVFGMFGPVMGLTALLGPIIGGGLVGLDLLGTGWRLVFLINLPVGLLALVTGARILPHRAGSPGLSLDWMGALITCAAGVALVYPLIQGRELGWPAWSFAAMAAGVLGLAGFGVEQRRRERRGAVPLVTPSVFSHRGYSLGLLTALLFFAAMIGAMLTLTLFLQLGQGYSALHAALTLIPWSLGAAIGAGAGGGALGPRFGRLVISAGAAVMLAGFALVMVAVGGGRVSSWDLAPGLLVSGLGMGLVVAPLFDIILAGVADHELGSGSGVLNAVQQLAGALGVAVLGTVFFSAVGHGGFAHALHGALWVALGLLAGVFVLSFGLPRWARDPLDLLQPPAAGEPVTVEA